MRRYLQTTVLALVVAFTLSANARADLIPWSYSWTPDSATVLSNSGLSQLSLPGEGTIGASGNSFVVATQITAVGTLPASTPDLFTGTAYGLTLSLTDAVSAAAGTLTFTGEFNGTLSDSNAMITNTFTGDTTQTLVLGANLYTVTIGPFVPPGPPGSGNVGGIGAYITVEPTGNANPASVPEPASLILASLGLAFGWAVRRRRKMASA